MARRMVVSRAMPLMARSYTPAKPNLIRVDTTLSPTRLMNMAFSIDHSLLLQACEDLSTNEDEEGSILLWEPSRPIVNYMA